MGETTRPIPNLSRPLQRRLFDPPATELMGELCIESAEVEAWTQTGLLSYDPRTREKLNEAEEAELTFAAAIGRSGLSYEAMCRALSQLEKPYAYWPSEVLWDFGQGKWRYVPGEIEGAVADAVEEALEGHISRLVEEGDLEGLQGLLNDVQRAISQIGDDERDAADGEPL